MFFDGDLDGSGYRDGIPVENFGQHEWIMAT
jgi:hypothetical protein